MPHPYYVVEKGALNADARILGNSNGGASAPDPILDLDALPNLLSASDLMRVLNISQSNAYRLMHDAGAVTYGSAKRHTVRLPKAKLPALIRQRG